MKNIIITGSSGFVGSNFVKNFTNIEKNIVSAVKMFVKEVKSKKFPSKNKSYK